MGKAKNTSETASVEDREIEFHDRWAESVDPKKVKVDAVGTACTMPETRFILQQAGSLQGKKILEVGCGCGEASVYFAKQGGIVTATDISLGMVKLTKKVAALHNVEVDALVANVEKLPFDDNSFDFVYVANVLHHVDFDSALSEIRRVLAPGGTFVQWDPVKYNPAINVYRKKAMAVRTVDENPIDKKYITVLNKYFPKSTKKGFWLFTCLIFVKYYYIDKIDPNKERYWKKVVDDAGTLKKMYCRLEKIDRVLLWLIPPLKWWCWNLVIIAKKEDM